MELAEAAAMCLSTGLFTAVSTVAALKTDIRWLKASVERAHERIDAITHNARHGTR